MDIVDCREQIERLDILLKSCRERLRDNKERHITLSELENLSWKRGKLMKSLISKILALRHELSKLLKRYNASVNFVCDEGSDIYGIYGESMVISVGYESYEVTGYSFEYEDL